MSFRTRRRLAVESLEVRRPLAADLNTLAMGNEATGETSREDSYFIADSFSFGVEREMKESGEKSANGVDIIFEGEASAGDDWFIADSFSFGVEREMKESGETQADGVDALLEGEASAANEWFIADSFSFGVEREMKESGEK